MGQLAADSGLRRDKLPRGTALLMMGKGFTRRACPLQDGPPRMKRLAFALVCLLALPAHARDLPPPTVAFPDQPLTLDDTLRIFRQRGLDLLIAEAAIWSAEGDVKAA